MRKVTLSMKAHDQYEIIKRLAEGHISKDYAAVKIGYTKRHINRRLQKYTTEGKSGFIHGNTGLKPVHTLSEQQKNWDTNFIDSKWVWDSKYALYR